MRGASRGVEQTAQQEVEVEVDLGSKQAFQPLGYPSWGTITIFRYMYLVHALKAYIEVYLAMVCLVDFPVIPGAGSGT